MEGPRKVLLTNFHLGNGGGHRTYILSLLKGTVAREFDLALACPAVSPINALARQNGTTVFDLEFPGNIKELPRILAAIRKLDGVYHEFPFDLIHCNGSRDHWIALYWKLLHRRPAKIVRSRHAVKQIQRDPFHAWAFNHATALNIFVSRGMIPLCEPPGKLKLKKTRVIPNGIDTDHLQPRERDQALAARLGIRETDFVIGSNAGLGAHKRADLMLKAVAGMRDQENVKILLMGEERASADYIYGAKQAGVKNALIYGGMQDDVRPYLSLFDLGFVLSDSIETSSYAAKEMMAMGVPLICSRYSGLPENVEEGKTGFLVAPGNVDEVRERAEHFIGLSPAARKEFRVCSREKAVREFSRQSQMDLVAQAYRDAWAGLP